MSYLFDFNSGISNEEDEVTKEARWIRRNIYMRECTRFVPVRRSTSQELMEEEECACGYNVDQHNRRSGVANILPNVAWSVESDTRRVMTNAFGEIDFVGYEDIQRKYVRADVFTPAKDLLDILLKCWGLKKPNLLISVTGGAKNFHMKPKLREVFRRGLIKVSRTTGAWILTGGTNTGVMKHVGEAVRDYRLTTSSTDPVVAIGVVTWGCIKNKEDLCDNFGTGTWPATYKTEITGKHEACLEPNHTHFILVDDGTQHRFGVDISFRAGLERAISDMKTDGHKDAVSIPIVLLIVEGGSGTLQSAYEAINNRIPIVVVKGSGRVADIIAYAYQYSQETEVVEVAPDNRLRKRAMSYMDSSLETKLRSHMVGLFGKKSLEQNLMRLKGVLEKRDLVTVFDICSSVTSSSRDIDVAMLQALLKANKDAVYDQLKLALSWNRIDIAKSEIFTEEKNWPSGSLDDIMFEAIIAQKADFVDLLIDNGVSLKEFLTKERLLQLYELIPKNSLLYSCLMKSKAKHGNKSEAISLKDIRRLTKLLISVSIQPYLSKPANKITRIGSKRNECRYPSEDLFLWAVLMHHQELAKLFWKLGKDATANALIAFGILRALSNKTEDTELRNKLLRDADEFGNLAVGVLTECFECDERKTHMLLMKRLDQCEGIICLDIALKTNNMMFIAHKACQSFYRDVWMGNLCAENGTWRLLLSPILLGLFILRVKEPTVPVEYTEGEESEGMEKGRRKCSSFDKVFRDGSEFPVRSPQVSLRSIRRKTSKMDSIKTGSKMSILSSGESIDTSGKGRNLSGTMKVLYRIRSVYTAPVMIFAHNVIAYITFLALFSYMLLFEFTLEVGKVEILLWIWVFNIFVEEVRQFSSSSPRKMRKENSLRLLYQRLRKRKKDYLSDEWNIVDIVTITLFIMGVCLRFCPNGYEVSRVVMACSLLTFFFRILHIFTVHKELGPKIIMIRRMMIDLVFFMIILMVFVSGYAIVTYAILYPNAEMTFDTIRNILKFGYWSLYGEFFLEEIEANHPNCSSSHSRASFTEKGEVMKCPLHREVAIILMGMYVLFSNLLLLNILIAMFSNTFQMVHDNTDKLWNYMRCTLIREFHTKPFLPAPLSLPIYVWMFIKWILRRFCGFCTIQEIETNECLDRETTQWENVIADAYMQRLKKKEEESMENVVAEIHKKFDDICQREYDQGQCYPDSNLTEKQLHTIDVKVSKIINLLRALQIDPGYSDMDDNSRRNSSSNEKERSCSVSESSDGHGRPVSGTTGGYNRPVIVPRKAQNRPASVSTEEQSRQVCGTIAGHSLLNSSDGHSFVANRTTEGSHQVRGNHDEGNVPISETAKGCSRSISNRPQQHFCQVSGATEGYSRNFSEECQCKVSESEEGEETINGGIGVIENDSNLGEEDDQADSIFRD